MIKQQLLEDLKKAVRDLGFPTIDIVLSITQNTEFGDYSSNIALQLSKLKLDGSKQSALEIAKKILNNLGDLSYLSKIKIAGPGFLNFFLKPEILAADLKEILERGENFGKNNFGKNQKIQVEFISANPTGPLTLANGRGGALGDTLANVLAWSGYRVDREYYVNDTGNQVRLLGESVLATTKKIPAKKEHYQGEYVKELVDKFQDKLSLGALDLGHLLANYLLENEIKPAIEKMDIKFDEYYSERSLYERSLIKKTAEILQSKGLAYEREGALWFKSTQFGDEKDRVLITSEEVKGRAEPTYLMPDIAHHLDLFKRGYIKRINILGADHHSYVMRLKVSVEAITKKKNWLDFILIQMVKLMKDGQEVRMSKRAGTYATLDELIESVGKDAVRFYFLMYDPHSHINFDLNLAKEKSQKNPVYYVQYAHARMSNILNKAQPRKGSPGEAEWGLLRHPAEIALVKHLTILPELMEEVVVNYQVQMLTVYSVKLADLFHRFYESLRVLNSESEDLKEARLALVKAGKIVLGNTLKLMGVAAPERM